MYARIHGHIWGSPIGRAGRKGIIGNPFPSLVVPAPSLPLPSLLEGKGAGVIPFSSLPCSAAYSSLAGEGKGFSILFYSINKRVKVTVIKIKVLIIIKRAIGVEVKKDIINLVEVYLNLIGVVL